MLNLDISLNNYFPILNGSQPIMDFLIDMPQKYLKNTLISIRNKRLYFLDQIITTDKGFLLTWKDIKKSRNISGRCPRWYFYFKDKFTYGNNLRLNFEPTKQIIAPPNFAERPPTPGNWILGVEIPV